MKWFTTAKLSDNMEETPEGFLLIRNVPIARCGTQLYRHNEVPQLEADAGGWLRIDREPQEVFHADTLASYEGKPLVDDHPDEPVTPSNWADLAIGHIANVRRGSNADHDLLFADILVTTDRGIRLIRRGKRAVSVGYDAAYEQQGRGRGRQTRIIANHLALVDEGRCGTRCTILDGAARFLDTEAGPAGVPTTVKIGLAAAPPERPHVALHGDLTLEYRADPDDTPLYQPKRNPAFGSTWHDQPDDSSGRDIDYPQTVDLDWQETEHPRDPVGKFSAGGGGKPPAMGAPVSTAGWKKVGGQLGSNPGAQMTDASGQKHYVKFAQSEAHARNEHLAAKLYEATGAPVLKTKLVDTGGGKLGTATEWAERRDIDIKDVDDRRQAHPHFATHAWLANWDAAGLTHDNQAEVDGEMTTLDPGGALIFRAQGGLKGEAFGHKVTEWDSLRHPSNKQAHELFGEMTPAQLRASAAKVAAVPSQTIRDLVTAHGPGTPEQRQALADKLVNRRNDVAKRAGLKAADRAFAWRDLIAVRHWVGGLTVSIRPPPRVRDDSQGWQGQPRVAAGQEGGGQWTEGGGGGAAAPALPEMKSKYFQKEAGKLQEAVQSAYASGGKQAALTAAQGLLGKWKHSVMQSHMAKAIQAIQAHPDDHPGGAPSEAEMEAMATEHEAPPPEPSVPPLGEPQTGSQKNVQYIVNHPDLSTGEKIAKLKDKIENYVNPENAAYAQAALAQLQGGGTSAPPPPVTPPPLPAAAPAPAPAALPAVPPSSLPQLPVFGASFAQKMIQNAGMMGKTDSIKAIMAKADNIADYEFGNKWLEATGEAKLPPKPEHGGPAATPATPATPGELPAPDPAQGLQKLAHGWAKKLPHAEALKTLGAIAADADTADADKAYAQKLIDHLGPAPGASAPAPAPAPAKPAPPPKPKLQGPAPFAGSVGQAKVHEIANDPTLSSAQKLEQIEAVKSDTNVSGPKTQEFANQWQEAIKQADPAGTATKATATPAAATPAAAAPKAAAKPKASPNLHTSGNKKLHARYAELRKNAANVTNAYDAKAAKIVPTMDKSWWHANSTPAQRSAIQSYKNDSSTINGYLRNPAKGGKGQAQAHEIDEVFENEASVLQQDTLCMRGETVDAKTIEEWKAGLADGHHVRPQRSGFTSTALANQVPSAFSGQNVIYEIVARKGTRALGFWAATPSHQTENEMVLRHGTAIEVYEIEKVGNQHIVRCVTL